MDAPEFGRIAVDRIEPPIYRQVLSAWCDQREGRAFPLRERIDPFVVPPLTPNLILYEVDGSDLIFRVLGEKVVLAIGNGLKGRTLRDAFGDSDYVLMVERQLLECAASGTPLYSIHDFRLPPGVLSTATGDRKAWRIVLPYGDGDRVTRLLCYQLFSGEIAPPEREAIDFAGLIPKTVFKIDVS